LEEEVLASVPKSYEAGDTSNEFLKGRREMVSWGYNEHNTKLQYRERNLPAFCHEIAKLLSDVLESPQMRLHKQEPGQIIPLHVDSYNAYVHSRRERGEGGALLDSKRVIRFLVFLTNGGMGEFFQVGSSVLFNWKAGDVITWPHGKEHLAANAGTTPKWTLQITGINKQATTD